MHDRNQIKFSDVNLNFLVDAEKRAIEQKDYGNLGHHGTIG
jgi:hypothetical protein